MVSLGGYVNERVVVLVGFEKKHIHTTQSPPQVLLLSVVDLVTLMISLAGIWPPNWIYFCLGEISFRCNFLMLFLFW